LFKYFDGDEYTGFRSWSFLRKYNCGCTACIYYFGNKESFSEVQKKDRMLFVIMGNTTNMGLVNGFGIHGGVFQHVDLVYMLPPILFKIPLLRDYLLWTGAVTWKGNDQESSILYLLNKGKSVAYSSNGMRENLEEPSNEIFEFAMSKKIYLVPVLIKNESKRYYIYTQKRIQDWFYQRIGWPFPLIFFPRIFDKKPPPKMEVHVGMPMDPTVQENAIAFKKLFLGQFEGLMNVTE